MSRHSWWISRSANLCGLWERPCYNTGGLGLLQMLLHYVPNLIDKLSAAKDWCLNQFCVSHKHH